MAKLIKAACDQCGGSRNHTILHREELRSPDSEYEYLINYMIVRCCGCGNTAFLEEFHDYEVQYPVDDDGRMEHEISYSRYPPVINDHIDLKYVHLLPPIVKQIYVETLNAIKTDSTILVGAGLRSIIESICNDRSIVGKDLKARINKMHIAGLIAKEDMKRLHGIRFLGNDAVHDIQPINKESMMIALKIIEHVLETLYLLSNAEKYLDLPIEEYDQFEKLIRQKTRETKDGFVFTLSKLLGKDLRRIEQLDIFEKQFKEKIERKEILWIACHQDEEKTDKTYYAKC